MTTYEHCKYRNVDGVLIACTDFSNPDVYEMVNGDLPVVTIDHIFDCTMAVMSDNHSGMMSLVDYAVENGHRKLAYIQGTKSAVIEKRLAGFYKACKNHGIEINPDYMIPGSFHSPDFTYKKTIELLKMNDPPTCIFMPDDYSAIGGYNAIHDLGLRIGADVSVVGYDGINYSQLLFPKLTTYRQNTAQLGEIAAQKLVELIENPQTTFNEVINVSGELVKGETVCSIN